MKISKLATIPFQLSLMLAKRVGLALMVAEVEQGLKEIIARVDRRIANEERELTALGKAMLQDIEALGKRFFGELQNVVNQTNRNQSLFETKFNQWVQECEANLIRLRQDMDRNVEWRAQVNERTGDWHEKLATLDQALDSLRRACRNDAANWVPRIEALEAQAARMGDGQQLDRIRSSIAEVWGHLNQYLTPLEKFREAQATWNDSMAKRDAEFDARLTKLESRGSLIEVVPPAMPGSVDGTPAEFPIGGTD